MGLSGFCFSCRVKNDRMKVSPVGLTPRKKTILVKLMVLLQLGATSEKYMFFFAALIVDWHKRQLSLNVWKDTGHTEKLSALQTTVSWTSHDINEDERPEPLVSAAEPSLSASDCLNYRTLQTSVQTWAGSNSTRPARRAPAGPTAWNMCHTWLFPKHGLGTEITLQHGAGL